MDAFVRRQIALLRERFLAHFARVRPLAGVRALVDLQEEDAREAALASRAFVRFLARVCAARDDQETHWRYHAYIQTV